MEKLLVFDNGVAVSYFEGGEFDTEYTRYLEEKAYYEREREIEKELLRALSTMDRNDPEYSDIYKEVFGVRPRW